MSRLDDHVVLANGVLLAGHVEVRHRAFLGGGAAVHQFTRIGELAMLAGLARITMDVPPFCLAGEDSCCLGVNVVGMRRAGLSSAERHGIRQCYRMLYRSGLTFTKATDRLAQRVQTSPGQRLLEFIRTPSKRGFVHGKRQAVGSTPDGEN